MSAAETFLRAALLGFSIAAPVGPIGLLVIRRSLASGTGLGFASGLGAAVADAIYGAAAALGLEAVAGRLLSAQAWLQLGGGAFLCWLGIATFRARPTDQAAGDRGAGLAAAFATTFLLTVTNPLTVLSFAALFAGLGLGSGGSGVAMVVGVFLGSAAWWLGLSAGVGAFRRALGPAAIRRVNQGSGLLLVALGVLAIAAR